MNIHELVRCTEIQWYTEYRPQIIEKSPRTGGYHLAFSKKKTNLKPATVPLDAVPRPSAGFRSHESPSQTEERRRMHPRPDTTQHYTTLKNPMYKQIYVDRKSRKIWKQIYSWKFTSGKGAIRSLGPIWTILIPSVNSTSQRNIRNCLVTWSPHAICGTFQRTLGSNCRAF